MRKDNSALLSIAIGLIIGVLAGIIAALVLAPRSRPENGRTMAGAASASPGNAESSKAKGQESQPAAGSAEESVNI